MPNDRPSPRLSRSRNLLFSAVLVVAALGVVEGALQLAFGSPQQLERYRWLVNTHLEDVTFAEFEQREADFAQARAAQGMERGRDHAVFGHTYNPTFAAVTDSVSLHVNSLGLRGKEDFPFEKPDGEIRVLCLGGSTTAGEDVADDETYPAQLEQLLRARLPGRSIRVINAGIPSYDVEKSLDHFQLRLHRLEPDVVTIYHGINDVLRHPEGGIDVTAQRNYAGDGVAPRVFQGGGAGRASLTAVPAAALDWFASWSHLARLVDRSVEAVRSEPPIVSAPDPAAVGTFAARYDALVKQVRAAGATPVAVTFAVADPGEFPAQDAAKVRASLAIWCGRFAASPDVGRAIVGAQNVEIESLARAAGIPLADAASAVPSDREHFTDCCHLTVAGNARIAAEVADAIMPALRERRAQSDRPSAASPGAASQSPTSAGR